MPLLERESQVETLRTMLDRIRGGEGGARVLWGGCEALFTPHPLAPLQDIAQQIGGDFPARIAASGSRHEIFVATLDRLALLPVPTAVVFEDVHWADEAVHSYVSTDNRKTFCVYDGPSPEAIRRVAARNELPVNRISEVRVLDPYFYR